MDKLIKNNKQNVVNILTKGGSKMKKVFLGVVAVLMLGSFSFSATIDEWKKMPDAPRLSGGTATETSIVKVNKAKELLQSKDLSEADRIDLLKYVVYNGGNYWWLSEAEYNQFKPYADELDTLIGKNSRTAELLYRVKGKEQDAITYCQDMIKEGKANDVIYMKLFYLGADWRTKDKELQKEAATKVIKLTTNLYYIKTCLSYAELSADDYMELLNRKNDEITQAVIDNLQKKGDAQLYRSIVSNVPYNAKVVASLKPFCELYKLPVKEQVEFYLLLWKANLSSVTENPEAKAIVDGAVTCIAQLLSLGENPSISQVEKLLSEMK